MYEKKEFSEYFIIPDIFGYHDGNGIGNLSGEGIFF